MDILNEVTTTNGKVYKLGMKDGELFYRWHGDGKTPFELEGGFTDYLSAELAMKAFLNRQEKEANKPSRMEELNQCKTNDDVKEFCKKYNFTTPDSTNLNARKKAIKDKLLAQGEKG